MTKKKIFYILLALVSLQFAAVGMLKLISFEALYQQLDELNISRPFGLVIGLIEVLCVVGLWIKPTRGLALLLLLFLAASAIAVHFGAAVAIAKAIPAMISFSLITVLLFLNNTQAMTAILRQQERI